MAATTRHFYVYIAASISGTLYIGVTNNLHKRIWQHKQGAFEGFTKQYEVNRLIYFESFDDIRTAINREKQLKGWSRRKKIWLVERVNPRWEDLSRQWYDDDRGPSTPFGSAVLRSG
ncbi:MAG: GIY-YIG nuclease family protein [Candidatus Korobacteraceae bacterium]|jgi:putative endonuclease